MWGKHVGEGDEGLTDEDDLVQPVGAVEEGGLQAPYVTNEACGGRRAFVGRSVCAYI